MKGKGLPHLNGTESGHLFVTLQIQTLSDLSSEQKRLLEAFEPLYLRLIKSRSKARMVFFHGSKVLLNQVLGGYNQLTQ